MSLWTPGGEVPIERNKPTAPPEPDPTAGGAASLTGGPSLEDLSPEIRAALGTPGARDARAAQAELMPRLVAARGVARPLWIPKPRIRVQFWVWHVFWG